jgi:hypothetical protein
MLADNSAWNSACSHQASRRCARWLMRPSSSPNVMLAGPPLCTITPGSAIPAKMKAAHHVVFPDRAGELLLVLDPVLQRHHRRSRTH